MNYYLPMEADFGGRKWQIRSDFRPILDICTALMDSALSERERGIVALTIFYPEFEEMPETLYNDAIKYCMWFISCGEEETEENQKKPKLVDWEQDFTYIVAPINKVAGMEIRALEYLHWWTFISYYNEIDGDSMFGQMVRIRDKLRRHEKLDKTEQRWYRENRSKVEFKQQMTTNEQSILDEWTKG